MAFWIFMLIMVILIPIIMIIVGKGLTKSAPKEINLIFGYRTTMSMKNKETWEFANKYIGKLWFKCGVVLLPITTIVMLFVLEKDTDIVGFVGGVIEAIQMIPLIGAIIPTEIALNKYFDKSGSRKYFLRTVSEKDAQILFDWTNDPVTRQNSFRAEPVIWEEHVNWLQQKLKDSNSLFFIMTDGQNDCGTIRIDWKESDNMISENYGLISFSIAPVYRGKGLGEKILVLAEQSIKAKQTIKDKQPIKFLVGEVKTENVTSRKCFEKNNYLLEKESDGELVFKKKI